MKPNRIRVAVKRLVLVLAMSGVGASLAAGPDAAVAPNPGGAALVIGAATYATLPGLPACARSANLMAAALKSLGFEVTERIDASSGAIDAGIGEFVARTAGRPAAFVYVCGYGASFSDRLFVLPVTARIARPSDILTQGLLAKTVLNTLSRDGAAPGIAVFDLFPRPGETGALGVDVLAAMPAPDTAGIAAAAGKLPGDAPTPIAVAFAAALTGPVVRSDGALTKAQEALTAAAIAVSIHMPVAPGYLAGAPRPRPPAPPVAAPPALPTAPAPVVPLPNPAAPPAASFPDEDRMTDLDRREAQIALARLGYYKGPIDGVFGVATRTAIEKFQTGLGATPTGRLTGPQASRLMGGGR